MAGGVGVFGPESGAKGIDVAEGRGHDFRFHLAADGEVGGATEEVFAVVGLAFFVGGDFGGVEGADAEHFARALAVAGGDDGAVDPEKFALAEELMDGLGTGIAYTHDRAQGVGAGAQVGDGAEEFEGVALLLQGVVFGGTAKDFDFRSLHLNALALCRGFDELALDSDGGSSVHSGDGFGVAGDSGVDDDLNALEAGAVVDFNEGEFLLLAFGAHPAFDGDGFVGLTVAEAVEDSAGGGARGHGGAGESRLLRVCL